MFWHEIELVLGHALPHDFLERFRLLQIDRLRDGLEAVHGADELLNAMIRPFCVASNAPLSKVNVCLETTGLHHYFEEHRVFSAYQIQVWKPAPDLFLMAANNLGIPPERCVVVEDSGFGIEAGLAAGMQVIAYDPHGRHQRDERVDDGEVPDATASFALRLTHAMISRTTRPYTSVRRKSRPAWR